jgi:hypothetical protein
LYLQLFLYILALALSVSGVCSRYGREKKAYTEWWGNLRDRDHLEDPGIDGRLI